MRISDWSSDVCSSDLERTPEEGLSTPTDEHEMRHLAAEILALDRGQVRRRCREQCAHPLHALEVACKPVRHCHGHGAQKAHHLQVPIDRKSTRLNSSH